MTNRRIAQSGARSGSSVVGTAGRPALQSHAGRAARRHAPPCSRWRASQLRQADAGRFHGKARQRRNRGTGAPPDRRLRGGARTPPDFIDGHQHVHVLPGVRGAILSAISARYGDAKPWVRNPFDAPGTVVARGVAVQKALVISAISTVSAAASGHGASPPTRDFPASAPSIPAATSPTISSSSCGHRVQSPPCDVPPGLRRRQARAHRNGGRHQAGRA